MSQIPTFAVVGRVNEGKSSIVAALTEDEDVPVGPEPGTTRTSEAYDVKVDDEVLFRLVDTPGFQEPEAVYEWLQSHAKTAAERPAAIRAFLAAHVGTTRYEDERRLLEPVMNGAVILYVVDASHPFRANHELEMQILQWTGQPRFALLNQSGPSDHRAAWETALGQYFSVVRPFNAHKVRLEDRLALLAMLAEMNAPLAQQLQHAIEVLKSQQARRIRDAALAIAEGLVTMVAFRVTEDAPQGPLSEGDKRRLERLFRDGVMRCEADARRRVEGIFRYTKPQRSSAPVQQPLHDQDLFSEEVWTLLGLRKSQIIVGSAVSGALSGGVIDAAVGGHSFGLGLLIGGALGSIGSAYALRNEPELRFGGINLAGRELVVGPHKDPRFPWVLLDRALLHAREVLRRSHAVRGELQVPSESESQSLAAHLSQSQRTALQRVFDRARKGYTEREDLQKVQDVLAASLASLA